MVTPALKQVLGYVNDDLVAMFRRFLAVSEDEARDIYTETLKWLWFAANAEGPAVITKSMSIIDEMWHLFITLTLDYEQFCHDHFGRLIHHRPITERERADADEQRERDPEGFMAQRRETMRAQCREVQRLLGDDTLYKWEVVYGQRYSPDTCRRLRIEALEAARAAAPAEEVADGRPAYAMRDAPLPRREELEELLLTGRSGVVEPLPKCGLPPCGCGGGPGCVGCYSGPKK